MIITIDKYKAIKKWKSIIESLNVNDDRKIELMSIYAEYNGHKNNSQNLTMDLKILSRLELENKGVIMSNFNDNKIDFINPHPMLKFTLSYEEIDTDIKLARKNKINAINGNINPNGLAFIQRLNNMTVSLIVSDINERLRDGQILYINQQIISEINIINAKPTTMEIKVTYDII